MELDQPNGKGWRHKTGDRVRKRCDRPKKAEDELKKHREQLEELVEQRTTKLQEANEQLRQEIAERERAEEEREKLILELQEALTKVRTLSGLLSICASCKKIRNDGGYWEQLEVYIRDRSEADFSHGLCPECGQRALEQLKKMSRE